MLLPLQIVPMLVVGIGLVATEPVVIESLSTSITGYDVVSDVAV